MRKNRLISSLQVMLLVLVVLVTGCNKYSNNDLKTITPESKIQLKASSAIVSTNGDTISILSGIQTKFWVDSLPAVPAGLSYTYLWNFGDGTPGLTTWTVEHPYSTGTYKLVLTIVNPVSGVNTVITKWIKAKLFFAGDLTIRLLSATPVPGGYDYNLGFLTSTISGFVPPLSNGTFITNPFVIGGFSNWVAQANPTYVVADGQIYLARHFVFANNVAQDFLFGQGALWSHNSNSIYWVSTGGINGKYVIYPYNGQIYNAPYTGVTKSIPGEAGDSLNGVNPPTVRDTLRFGLTHAKDSLYVYINTAQYANGPRPFINFAYLNNSFTNAFTSTPVLLKKMSGSYVGWSYYPFSIADIKANSGVLYFAFGPDINNPIVYGDMSKSVYYRTGSCALQIVTPKSGVYEIKQL